MGNINTDESAEESLSKEWHSLFEYVYDAVVISKFETVEILETNPEAEDLFGEKREGLVGHSLSEFMSPFDLEMCKKKLRKNSFHYVPEAELRVEGEGVRVVASISMSTIPYHGKKAILSIFHDITERKRMEEQLRDRARRLQQTNEQLEELMHVISHDLTEPLRTIGSYSDMLRMKGTERLEEKSLERLERIKKSVRQMKRLLSDLSDLGRISEGKAIGSGAGEVKVSELVGEIEESFQGSYPEARIEVMDDFPRIPLSSVQLRVLLDNLISNGLKYNSPPRKVKVGFKYGEERKHPVFFVRDNGRGIEKEYQDRIFNMFERLEPEEDVQGTGAGLAFCKHIVESRGGRIWVESEPGRRSTFYFTLPGEGDQDNSETDRGRYREGGEEAPGSSSMYDPKTGLYSRDHFQETLEKEAERARRYNHPIAFLVVGFQLKKSKGVEVPFVATDSEEDEEVLLALEEEELLMALAGVIQDHVRNADVIARYDCNSFSIMLPETDGGVSKVAERLQEKLESSIQKSDLSQLPLEFDIGCSHWQPGRSGVGEERVKEVFEEAKRKAQEKDLEKESEA